MFIELVQAMQMQTIYQQLQLFIIFLAGGAIHSYLCELPPQKTRSWNKYQLYKAGSVHSLNLLKIGYIIFTYVQMSWYIWYI